MDIGTGREVGALITEKKRGGKKRGTEYHFGKQEKKNLRQGNQGSINAKSMLPTKKRSMIHGPLSDRFKPGEGKALEKGIYLAKKGE